MIRTEAEYQKAVRRLEEEKLRLAEHRTRLAEMGLGPEEMKRVLDPIQSFHLQLAEEVESYERLKRGEFGELTNLYGLGRLLVGLRIALGLTQRVLASRLEVDESQVSRDERNEYHGISIERVNRILDVMGVQLKSRLDEPVHGGELEEMSTSGG